MPIKVLSDDHIYAQLRPINYNWVNILTLRLKVVASRDKTLNVYFDELSKYTQKYIVVGL